VLHELWLEFLARGAQQQGERERAAQEAKDAGVAGCIHESTIAQDGRFANSRARDHGCCGASSLLDFAP
jgi:hypothetical protein